MLNNSEIQSSWFHLLGYRPGPEMVLNFLKAQEADIDWGDTNDQILIKLIEAIGHDTIKNLRTEKEKFEQDEKWMSVWNIVSKRKGSWSNDLWALVISTVCTVDECGSKYGRVQKEIVGAIPKEQWVALDDDIKQFYARGSLDKSDAHMLKILLTSGLDPNLKAHHPTLYHKPISLLSCVKNVECAELLLSHGASATSEVKDCLFRNRRESLIPWIEIKILEATSEEDRKTLIQKWAWEDMASARDEKEIKRALEKVMHNQELDWTKEGLTPIQWIALKNSWFLPDAIKFYKQNSNENNAFGFNIFHYVLIGMSSSDRINDILTCFDGIKDKEGILEIDGWKALINEVHRLAKIGLLDTSMNVLSSLTEKSKSGWGSSLEKILATIDGGRVGGTVVELKKKLATTMKSLDRLIGMEDQEKLIEIMGASPRAADSILGCFVGDWALGFDTGKRPSNSSVDFQNERRDLQELRKTFLSVQKYMSDSDQRNLRSAASLVKKNPKVWMKIEDLVSGERAGAWRFIFNMAKNIDKDNNVQDINDAGWHELRQIAQAELLKNNFAAGGVVKKIGSVAL